MYYYQMLTLKQNGYEQLLASELTMLTMPLQDASNLEHVGHMNEGRMKY